MWIILYLPFILCTILYAVTALYGHRLKRLNYYFKIFLFYFLIFLSSIVVIPPFLLRPRDVKNGTIYARVMKHMNKLLGIEWHIRNGEYLSGDYGAVILNNHQCIFDALGMFNAWEIAGKMCVIMKKELFYAGTFGIAAYLGGGIYIDRKNAKNAHKTIQDTNEALTKNKTKIWIYPEGTRNKNPNRKLLPFKKGAFHMAIQSQAPIIPVVFSPYYFMDSKTFTFDKGHIIIQCLEPIPTAGLTTDDIGKLSDRIHESMSSTYEKLWDEIMTKNK
ncbi:1-acyl-sn-glycerol-3-phosphate acyltransferase alpha [Bombyx mori]|uniref:1-acyl-sn-glycerol-3-phosphate acyltransferase n=1 Tax=Bombyx mori TaxID=7091 RepID=A0A8R2AK05_BOMMO|nr:1-acyl-sn-glycerol-3-phosphate acyltransferase alpha-like [Bombyx mori]